jgi:hypothetical protein
MPDLIIKLSTLMFAVAVIHTFFSSFFLKQSKKFTPGSAVERTLHLLSDIEIIFGLWAGVWTIIFALYTSEEQAVDFLETLNFTEPLFVFVIMIVAASKPVKIVAAHFIELLALFLCKVTPGLKLNQSFLCVSLGLGPLLGSIITEPAAMTVLALFLRDRFFNIPNLSSRTKYLLLAVLFVNISIGGLLTHFAAPPVVMVASAWQWGTFFMLKTFGWKAVTAVFINTLICFLLVRKELSTIQHTSTTKKLRIRDYAITSSHAGFLFLTIIFAHRPIALFAVFISFLGFHQITTREQDRVQLKESFLVGFFLAGLVVLGAPQSWWLKPLLESLTEFPLFLGATLLTAITDNAALTYLGSQVEGLSDTMKYALVSGAVTGGGLTVIANAPNPAGYGILKNTFGERGLEPIKLFVTALLPTLVAALCFLLL